MLLSLLLSSCEKSGDKPKPDGPKLVDEVCKIKSIDVGGSSLAFTYDVNQRVQRAHNIVGKDTSYSKTYIYETNKIKIIGLSAGGGSTSVYNLDTSGRIISDGNTTFKYNSEGYLIEAKALKMISTFTYQDGNLIKADELYSNNYKISTLLEYNTTTTKSIIGPESPLWGLITMAGDPVLINYFGKPSKNLRSKRTVKDSAFQDQVVAFTYQMDDKGKINSVKQNATGVSPFSSEMKFIYDCK